MCDIITARRDTQVVVIASVVLLDWTGGGRQDIDDLQEVSEWVIII